MSDRARALALVTSGLALQTEARARAQGERLIGVMWRTRQARDERFGAAFALWLGGQSTSDQPGGERLGAEVLLDSDDLHYVRLNGELDLSVVEQVENYLIDKAGSVVVVDLGGVSFIDAAGVGALLSAKAGVEERGHRFELCGANPRARLVFELCGLEQLLDS